ncbi:MAG: DUF1080 domain-containing protein [Bryobacterales bacterium]|jgi:hypothetical protein|nr:DUF1080 domain-containing protein [Bryobacterales bacterium]
MGIFRVHPLRGLRAWLFVLMGAFAMPLLGVAADWCQLESARMHPLTSEEQAAGWTALFQGGDVRAWRGFHTDMFPTEGWRVEHGTLWHREGDGRGGRDGGDLVSRERYSNFELAADWCLQPGGNSGVKYLVVEAHTPMLAKGAFGLEYQLIDDLTHSDAKQDNRKTAGVYDVAAVGPKVLRPAGQWNHLRLIVQQGTVEHWLNGERVLSFALDSDQFRAWVAGSKYKDDKRFGASREGHIVLQEHGTGVAFRNIKVRRLP